MKFEKMPARQVTRPNQAWAIDFALLDLPQKSIVMLVIDVGTRMPLSATTLTRAIAGNVIATTLDRLGRRLGKPEQIWMDYGFANNSGHALQKWARRRAVLTHLGMISTVSERHFRSLGNCLRDKHFPTLVELGREMERWRQSYVAALQLSENANQ
jgi:hypothetical protein